MFSLDQGTAEIMRQDDRAIGYMPQELALHVELSARETLDYFSRLHGLSKRNYINNLLINFHFHFLKNAISKNKVFAWSERLIIFFFSFLNYHK